MAQVTPEEAGLAEFSPRGTSEHELQFLIAYYTKLLQTQGITGTEDVNLTKIDGQVVAVNNGPTTNGTQRVTLSNDGTGVIATVGTVTTLTGTTSLTPGTAAANLGKAEDAVAGSGDTGVMALAVRRDTAAPSAADLDYNTLNVDALGKMWVRPEGGAPDNAAATGNPNQVGGVAVVGSSYAPAYTAGDAAVVPIDTVSGGLLCHTRTLTTTDQVTNVPIANSVTRISSATTTVVKSGSGTLASIIINKHVASSAITVYDNTSAAGTILAIITPGAALLTDPPIAAAYNIPFATGLTIVTAGASDLTIVYR